MAAAPLSAPWRPVGFPGDGGWLRGCTLVVLAAPVLLLGLPYAGGDPSSLDITPADVSSALLVGFCVLQLLRRRTRPLSPAAALVLSVPALGMAVATVTATDPAAALPGLIRYMQIFVLVPAAVVLLVRDAKDFRVVAGSLVLLALVEGGLGVHQYVTGTGASYMGQNIRAVGTFGASDVMGMATVVAFGLVAALGLALKPGAHSPVWWRPVLLLVSGALCVPLVLSFSRGAWIATLITVVGLFAFAGRRRFIQLVASSVATSVILVGGFGVGSDMLGERLTSITQVTDAPDQSVTDRYTMWAAATGMWREHPVTGVGLKGFPAHRDGHASLALSAGSDTGSAGSVFKRQPLLSPHNMYLLVLSEQGLLGALTLIGGWLAVLVLGVRKAIRGHRSGAGAYCGPVAVALLAWQLIDFLYADIGGPSTVLTGIVFGLGAWWALAAPVEHDGL